MTKVWIPTLGFAVALALASSAAQAQNTRARPAAGQKFMTEAIQGDLAEIQMGQLAEQNGSSPQVKQFGQKLVTDHSANLQKADSVAESMGITPPNQPNAKQKADHNKLSKLSGSRFDRQFARDMVRDHKKDIAEFEKQTKRSGPTAQFAQQTLPTLRQHLKIAESLNRSTTGSSR